MARSKTKISKLYVGKVFSLKNYKNFDVFPLGHRRGQRVTLTREELGHVLIIDEKGKAVEIWTGWNGGYACWLTKFYLMAEIKEEIPGNATGELTKVISELGDVGSDVRAAAKAFGNGVLTTDYQAEMAGVGEKLNKLIRRLRLVQETLESESKSE